MEIKIKKLHPDAKIPKYALPGDAGMDLFSIDDLTIEPGQIGHINTGIAIEIPSGYVGLIWDKGSIGMIHGQKTLGGVFDSNYRGEYTVALANLTEKSFVIEKGSKVAQLLIQKIECPTIIEIETLSESNRGEGRWGSTGQK